MRDRREHYESDQAAYVEDFTCMWTVVERQVHEVMPEVLPLSHLAVHIGDDRRVCGIDSPGGTRDFMKQEQR